MKRLIVLFFLCSTAFGVNDFSSDAACEALWNLESGALTTDSKAPGTNTLTNSTVTDDLVDFKQGSCSGLWIASESDRMYRADADLSSGFPLKSGETNRTFSFTFWLYLNTIDINHYLMNKTGAAGTRTIIIYVNTAEQLNLVLSVDGTAWTYYAHASALSATTWYHVGITHDSADEGYVIHIWDDTAQATLGVDKTGTTVTPFISTSPFSIGYASVSLTLNGNLDEVVVFNDELTSTVGGEIDQIRAGTYGASVYPKQIIKAPDLFDWLIFANIEDQHYKPQYSEGYEQEDVYKWLKYSSQHSHNALLSTIDYTGSLN